MSEQKKITFKGKTYKYNVPTQLFRKLRPALTFQETRRLIKDYEENKTVRYLQSNTGQIAKYDIRDKPIVFRKFGVQRVPAISLLKDSKIKDVKIFKTGFTGNVKVKINVITKIRFSTDYEEKTFSTIDTLDPNNITENEKKEIIKKYYNTAELDDDDVIIDSFEPVSTITNQKLNITDNRMSQATPINIGQLYNEVIENKNGRCVQDYLNKIYNKFSSKEIEKLHTTNDLYDYAVKHRIKMIAYDINGNIIKSHYPTKRNQGRKNLIYICYNNHLYPLKNTILNKNTRNKIYINMINIPDLENKLIEFLNIGILPNEIKFFNSNIKSFIVDNILYFDNPDYDICKSILKSFGLSDRMYYNLNLSSIGNVISDLYTSDFKTIKSFIPHNVNFTKGAVNYYNEEFDKIDTTDNIYTIDKNKAYSYALTKLDYLISVDFKTAKIRTTNIKHNEIKKHYWYIVDPKYSSNLLDNLNVYDGEHLLYCIKEGLEFEILEEIETTKHENYYKEMIWDIYEKVEPEYAKKIVNIFIGKLERNNAITEYDEFVKVCNKQEADTFTGFKKYLTNDFVICSSPKNKFSIYTQKPIAYQIKDYTKRCMYEMMKKLKMKSSDIMQVKTDSITFKSDTFKKGRFINKKLDGWKFEVFKKKVPKEPIKNNLTFKLPSMTENKLYQQYAGGGKTYSIVNNVIPKANNYLILSPSHISIAEYRKHKFNCNVIQAYTLNNKIPTEQNIIIDEYGMLDNQSWNLIYKCILLNKNIQCWGDHQQLLPVTSDVPFNVDNWLYYCFCTINTEWTNRRNKFTRAYYDDLINENIDVKKEVNKYSKTNVDDAEYIIVHRNETRHKYNSYICNKLNIKSKCDIGTKLICITNDLRKYDIYNKYCFTVKEINNDKIILHNEEFNLDLELTEEQINKNFDYSYARTIYNLQGQTINNYYWATEDNKFLDGRMAYTIISRLCF